MRFGAAALLLLALIPFPLFAQTSSTAEPATQTTQTGSEAAAGTTPPTTGGSVPQTGAQSSQPAGQSSQSASSSTTPEAVPYSPDEFPAWLRDLRRAEVISIGAFPITVLFSSLGYQLMRYAQNGFSQAYAPALAGSGTTPLTNQQRMGVLIGGAVLSMLVAFVDFAIGQAGKSG